MSDKGSLFLIPNTLGAENISKSIPLGIIDSFENVIVIFVEQEKVARRLLIQLGLKNRLDEFELISMKQGINKEVCNKLKNTLMGGKDAAIISDAGCPAIADPGNELVQIAHEIKAKVIPNSGPSSIILALMASGFNGQQFAFHGYLSKDSSSRKNQIRVLDKRVHQHSQTQIFIETPYRNQYVFEDLLSECQKKTKICLAVNLTMDDEWIAVKELDDWKKDKPDLRKKQCIYLIYK
jgi:16S rRNA (cytidine1402-2'-O)-methyltransferase